MFLACPDLPTSKPPVFKGIAACFTTLSLSPFSLYFCTPPLHQLLSASDDFTAKLWDLRSGRRQQTFRAHSACVTHAEFALEGRRVVTASADHSLTLWEVSTGKVLATLPGHTGAVTCCSVWWPFVASSGIDGKVRVWLLPR